MSTQRGEPYLCQKKRGGCKGSWMPLTLSPMFYCVHFLWRHRRSIGFKKPRPLLLQISWNLSLHKFHDLRQKKTVQLKLSNFVKFCQIFKIIFNVCTAGIITNLLKPCFWVALSYHFRQRKGFRVLQCWIRLCRYHLKGSQGLRGPFLVKLCASFWVNLTYW